MVGYIYLISAVLIIVLQFSLTKVFQKSVKQCLITSLLFSFICGVTQCLFFYIYGVISDPANAIIHITPYSLILSICIALASIGCAVCGILVMSKGNLSIYSLFMMLGGMLLPFIEGAIFQAEQNPLTPARCIAVVLLPIFLTLQVVLDKKEVKENNKKSSTKEIVIYYILCFVIFCLNGSTSIIQSLESNPINGYEIMEPSQFTCLRTGINAILALIFMVIVYFCGDKKQNLENLKDAISGKVLVVTCLQAVVSGCGGFLLLLANASVPSVVQYPIVSGGTIVLTTVASTIIFKEKQSRVSIIFITLSALATILFVF